MPRLTYPDRTRTRAPPLREALALHEIALFPRERETDSLSAHGGLRGRNVIVF